MRRGPVECFHPALSERPLERSGVKKKKRKKKKIAKNKSFRATAQPGGDPAAELGAGMSNSGILWVVQLD